MLKTIHQLVRIFTTIIAIFMATSINTETKAQTKPQEEQNELYLKTWDYDPDEKEVDNLYDDDFDEWLLGDELE